MSLKHEGLLRDIKMTNAFYHLVPLYLHFILSIRHVIYQFSYFSTKTYVMGAQKNRLNETVLLSTQNICSN